MVPDRFGYAAGTTALANDALFRLRLAARIHPTPLPRLFRLHPASKVLLAPIRQPAPPG